MAETQNSKQNVQAPQAGQTVIVNAIPGQDIVLEAAFDQAEVKLDSGNVIFEFANGGQVVLDFSDIGTAQAPNVVMPDGTVLNMEQFLASLGESDVEPAAGPEGGADGSGGVGQYREGAGDLLEGVAKLGVLDPREFTSVSVEALDADDINSIPELLDGESVLVEDEKMIEGNDEDDGGVGFVTGTIVDNVNWGSDGFGGVVSFNVGGASFAPGTTVFWGQDGAFLGTSSGGAAASLIVNTSGIYTFTLLQNMLIGQGVQGEQINVLSTVQIIGADTTGDTVSIPLNLNVEDDVPEIRDQMGSDTAIVEDEKMQNWLGRLATDEPDGLKGYFEGTIVDNVKWGADGFGGVTKFSVGKQEFTFGPEDTVKTVFWKQDGGFLGEDGGEGAAASLTVNSDGSYLFKLLDNMLLGEGEQGEQIDELATVVITGVDNDGDEIGVGVALQVQDDVPLCITVPDIAIVEDEAMEGGNNEKWDGLKGYVEGTIVNNVAWGADGFGEATTFTIDGHEFPVGNIVYWDQNGNFLSVPPYLEGAVSETQDYEDNGGIPEGAAASLVVNSDGTYTFKLLDNMLLGKGVQGEQINLLDTVTVTAQDGDGDKVNVKVYLKVQDDVPVAVKGVEEVKVDEDDIKTKLSQGNYPDDGNADGSYTGNPAYATGGPANVSGSVSHLVSFGADGGTFSLSDNFKALESQKLFSKGDALEYSLNEAGDTLIASAGGRMVFTLELEADGDYKFSLFDQLDHPKGGGENNLPIHLASVLMATDGDGDVLLLTKGFAINVTDDVPIETGRAVYGLVEEEMLPGGNQEWGDGTNFKVATGSLASQVSFGADDKGSFALSLEGKGLPAISSNGEPVVYSIVNTMLTAKAGDLEIFTLQLSSNGYFKFTLKGPIDHEPGKGENLLLLNLSAFVKATDFDGDTITLGDALYIKVIDDTPVAASKAEFVRVNENDLLATRGEGEYDGNDPNPPREALEIGGDIKDNVKWGADGFGKVTGVTWDGGSASIADGQSSVTVYLDESGAVQAGSAEAAASLLVKADGTYTFTLLDNLLVDTNKVIKSFAIQAQDADGDAVPGGIKLNVEIIDDLPVANGAQNVVIANAVGTSETVPTVTNLIMTLDLSGSMAGAKFTDSINAMTFLIDQYQANGGVNVQLTTFGTNAGPSSAWLDASAAKALLASLSVFTGQARYTNYEAAIFHTILGDSNDPGVETDPYPTADQTVAYFVTDGAPNREYQGDYGVSQTVIDVSGTAVDSGFVTAWQNFVASTVNHLFVIAVQTSVTDLDLVNLVNGVTPLGGGTAQIVAVTDTSNMLNLLEGTIVTGPPVPVSATADLGIAIGADGWGSALISDVATMDDGSGSVRFVTAVAANGSPIIATSGGVKLYYEDDGNGGLVAKTYDEAGEIVFKVTLDQQPDGTPLGTYTVTMLGTVDPYVVPGAPDTTSSTSETSSETSGLPVSLTKTDSLTFYGADNSGGGKAQVLNISKVDADTGITLNIQATGSDNISPNGENSDFVNWSSQGIGVGNNFINNPKWDPSESLKLVFSATNLPSGVTGIKIDSISLVFDSLSSDETARWDVSPGSANDGSISGIGNGANEANDIPVNIVLGSGSTAQVTFTASDGSSYRIDPGVGIKVNYSYVIEVPTTVVTTTTVTTETTTIQDTAYDITLLYKVGVTDGDNDYVSSDFHVTIDANNDGIMHAVGTDTVVGNADLQSSSTITTVNNTYVYYNDGGNIVDVSNDTVTNVTNESSSSNVSVVASGVDAILMETVDGIIDPTDSDVMVAGDDQDYAMFGGGGDDILLGGDGNDFLVGNAGDDVMTGGAGSDSFEPANGADTITDFEDGIDTMLTTINPELP